MIYIITDGFRYISTIGGIHSVYTFEEATKFEDWKVNCVFISMPKYLKEYGLTIKLIESDNNDQNEILSGEAKKNKRIERFFKSWKVLNNNLMAYQCEAKGIEYKGIKDATVLKYWKSLKLYERKSIMDKYSVDNETDLFELLSVA